LEGLSLMVQTRFSVVGRLPPKSLVRAIDVRHEIVKEKNGA